MKLARYIHLSANVLAWGGLVWIGAGLLSGVELRHIAGYPSSNQIEYYVTAPAVMLAVATVPTIILSVVGWTRSATAWPAATLLALFPYLLPYTGGV